MDTERTLTRLEVLDVLIHLDGKRGHGKRRIGRIDSSRTIIMKPLGNYRLTVLQRLRLLLRRVMAGSLG
jgi:hypothetical protein